MKPLALILLFLLFSCEEELPWNEYHVTTEVIYLNTKVDTLHNTIYADFPPSYVFDTVTGNLRRLFLYCDSNSLVIIAKEVKTYQGLQLKQVE